MSERERGERVDHVAEELSVYFSLMAKHQKSFAKGEDKKLYELVEECFKQLWEAGVENTYKTQWQDVAVWKRIKMEAGDAERRIREQVRWRLDKARKLGYQRWWVSDGVDPIGEYVERWFGGASRPADAEDKVAEKLRDLWDGLVAHQKHNKSFREGDDKKFYELVEKCFDELWVGDERSTWTMVLWKRLPLEPEEQERRIRENVRPWLRRARRLKYTRSSVTNGVDGLGEYVERWFGGAAGAQAVGGGAGTRTPTPTAAEKMGAMLAELKALVDKYAKS